MQRTFVNLGFEQPALTGNNCHLIFSATAMDGWETNHPNNVVSGACTLAGFPSGAAITQPIEIWRGPNFSGVPPRTGDQHAELNAYQASRLSQTICLATGEQIDWSLSHRGRNSATVADVMNFNIDSTANTVAVLSSTTVGTGGPPACSDSGGVDNVSCTAAAGPNNWRDYSGRFIWNGASGNHTFGFQAIGGTASGNFLDEIQVTLRPYVEFNPASFSTREGQAASLPQLRITGTVPAGGMTVLPSSPAAAPRSAAITRPRAARPRSTLRSRRASTTAPCSSYRSPRSATTRSSRTTRRSRCSCNRATPTTRSRRRRVAAGRRRPMRC